MRNWLTANLGTIAVSALLVLVVAAIIVKMIRDKKQGKHSCAHGCANCAMSGVCHKKQ